MGFEWLWKPCECAGLYQHFLGMCRVKLVPGDKHPVFFRGSPIATFDARTMHVVLQGLIALR